MATVYNAPATIEVPCISKFIKDGFDRKAWSEAQKAYIEEIRVYLVLNGWGSKPNFGEVITFSVADGFAEYMVIDSKTAKLVHIPLGDAYESEVAHLSKSKDIMAAINRRKSLKEIFGTAE
jgi:hypothetical protein